MLSKSLDWFLYDRDLRHERVKEKYDYGKMESRINLLLLLEVKFHQQNTEILSAGTNEKDNEKKQTTQLTGIKRKPKNEISGGATSNQQYDNQPSLVSHS